MLCNILQFIKSNFVNLISLLNLIVISIIAIKGWQKHRNIYDIEIHEISNNRSHFTHREKLSKKLSSGE